MPPPAPSIIPRAGCFGSRTTPRWIFCGGATGSEALRSGEEVDMIADPADTVASRQIAATSLRTFMRLPVAQRSSVILMDVLGCSLQEICEVMDCSLPAAKAALHRGRAQFREYADEPDDMPQPDTIEDRSRSSRRLCRAFQRAGFRRHPRHDRRRRPARSRQQDAPERQGRGCPDTSATIRRSAIGIWCPDWWKAIRRSWCSIRTSGRSEPKYFMLLQLVGRQGRDHPRFPPRGLRHRGRRFSPATAGDAALPSA